MPSHSDQIEFARAFADYDRQVSIANSKVGSILASILMPLGSVSMDFFVYEPKIKEFFLLRVASSVLTLGVLWLLFTRWGERHYRILRMAWYWVPMFFITLMIYLSRDPASPYYAGLNLVFLGAGVVLPWTYKDLLMTAGAVLPLYVVTYILSIEDWSALLANNLFFLGCTAVVVVTGGYFHNRLRYREFSLRFELEKNRKIIEENNRKLVELDQAKSRFFANISHELRTPLTLLLAPLQSIRARYGHLLDSEALDMLASMRANGMRLLKLINDLLDLVRLEEGRAQIDRSPVSIARFVRGLAGGVQHTAETRRIKVEVSVAESIPTVMVDRDKLEKILLNLLFNALKFTHPGGQVFLKASTEAESLVLSVRDTGIGISRDDLKKLFQRFWQADSSAHRKYQGAGIGLALVKELTEAQGGTVAVDSEIGRGTVFTVRLPLLLAPEGQVSTEADQPHEIQALREDPADRESGDGWLKQLYREAQLYPAESVQPHQHRIRAGGNGKPRSKVLVADDEPDMLRFLSAELNAHYDVIEATDGRVAVEHAGKGAPDVIVLDMMMPELDGLGACRMIRAHEATRHTPIIMLTARADEETKLEALEAGANDFLTKPFSVTELHVRVRNLMERHQSRLELATQNKALEEAVEQLREVEMQLLQSEKLASLGELSAGMSHEIKNPLNYALTGVYALKQKAALLSEAERADYSELVASVEEGVRRVMNIVNDLRQLAHPQLGNREHVKVVEATDTALRLLNPDWGGKVTIQRAVEPSLAVHANRSMMVIVMLNLLKNALDALAGQSPANSQPTVWIEGEAKEGRAIIRIRDNGPGIALEHQQQVFDILGLGDFAAGTAVGQPETQGRVFRHFFTTKAAGAGMGMGLSICRRIVRTFDGRISFRSEPGAMCEFTLDFPLALTEAKHA